MVDLARSPSSTVQPSCGREPGGTLIRLEKLDARVPQWNIDGLTARVCPFCRTKNPPALVRPDRLSVAFCHTCGCWYVDRRPSIQAVTEFYDGYYDTHRPARLCAKQAALMIADARKAARFDWHLQVLSQTLGGLRRKRIVEVGCGLCRFLLMAKAEEADVAGCDLSPEACMFAREHLGIMVHQQTLSECCASIGPADAVVMRNLVEHLIDPLVDIETACVMLKRGGCLLLHTPNGGEAGNDAEAARKWVGFRVDFDHLQYLSAQTINWLSGRFGFVIERLEASGFPRLKGIGKRPNRESGVVSLPRDAARSVPGMRRMVRAFRAMKEEIAGSRHDPRLGFYHLFAVLRKM